LKTFFYIFIKTLVLWKRNVSIVATPFVVAPIRNSALTSAGTTTTTGLTVTLTISSEMFTDCLGKTGGYSLIFMMKANTPSTGMPFSPAVIIETSDGRKYHYCYEYGYRETDGDFVELKQNSQYIEYQ
jgi:hypothetical protein